MSKFKSTKVILGVLAALYAIFAITVMIANYRFPSFFFLDETNSPTKGVLLTDTVITMNDKLASNWLPNDVLWPTIYLDNPQNFQLGELEALRYTTRVMRDKLSKLRTTDKIDPDIDAAFSLLSNDAKKWIFPSAESRLKQASVKLRDYRKRLLDKNAEFYPRSDNLNELLDQYVSLLGGINARLADAPNQQRVKSGINNTTTDPEKSIENKISWDKIDDNFYYAQGVAYALRQIMVAIKYEFKDILQIKNALPQVDSIIEVLDQSQFEPLIVLNGKVGGLVPNHSMELHSILENARQKIKNLNDMLAK